MTNPGFETGTAGWTAGNTRTTLARTCVTAHGGACSAQLGRARASGDAVLDDTPATVGSTAAGATYAASGWVQAPAGRTIRLRLRERSGGSLVRTTSSTLTADGGWQRLTLTSAATVGGTSLSVEVTVSLPKNGQAQVDDVSLKKV